MMALAERAERVTGYLENQVFAPDVERGRELLWARGAATSGPPHLARAAEEHSGPTWSRDPTLPPPCIP